MKENKNDNKPCAWSKSQSEPLHLNKRAGNGGQIDKVKLHVDYFSFHFPALQRSSNGTELYGDRFFHAFHETPGADETNVHATVLSWIPPPPPIPEDNGEQGKRVFALGSSRRQGIHLFLFFRPHFQIIPNKKEEKRRKKSCKFRRIESKKVFFSFHFILF